MEPNKNAVNDFGSCELSELDYILKKQTELTSESRKELDLFGDFLGQCQKVTKKAPQVLILEWGQKKVEINKKFHGLQAWNFYIF